MPRDDSCFSSHHNTSGNLFSKLINLIPIAVCVGCKRAGQPFCGRCYRELQWIEEPVCAICGIDHRWRDDDRCFVCRHTARYVQIRSAVWFEGAIREAVHNLKYKNQFGVATVLGGLLVDRWAYWQLSADLIVPIPLHPDREKIRGYNQAELLARHLAKAVDYPLELNALFRQRATAQQVSLKGEARQNNVEDAFVAHPAKVRGKRILLIDDVCTTGATLNAAAFTLLNAGAQAIFAYCVARTPLHEYY